MSLKLIILTTLLSFSLQADKVDEAIDGLDEAENVLDDAVSALRTRMIITWVIAGVFIIYGSVMMYLWIRAKNLIARGP